MVCLEVIGFNKCRNSTLKDFESHHFPIEDKIVEESDVYLINIGNYVHICL